MMVRILSILPGTVGLLCSLILLISLIGYYPDDSRIDVPIVPCSDEEACFVGMTEQDLTVPRPFLLLEINLEVSWSEPDRGWLAVVRGEAAEVCPPTDGLTSCTEEDILDFIIDGGSNSDELALNMKPGNYRFVTGGQEGSGLDSQLVTLSSSVHLNNYVELVLVIVSVLLFAGAGEMAFPLRRIWKKFRDA